MFRLESKINNVMPLYLDMYPALTKIQGIFFYRASILG